MIFSRASWLLLSSASTVESRARADSLSRSRSISRATANDASSMALMALSRSRRSPSSMGRYYYGGRGPHSLRYALSSQKRPTTGASNDRRRLGRTRAASSLWLRATLHPRAGHHPLAPRRTSYGRAAAPLLPPTLGDCKTSAALPAREHLLWSNPRRFRAAYGRSTGQRRGARR